MDTRTKAVVAMLHNVSYTQAKEILAKCELPEEEHLFVVEHVVYRKPLSYLADMQGVSYSTAKRILKHGLVKVWQTFN